MASTDVMRDRPLVGGNGLVFYGPVEDIIAGDPGLTLVFGRLASGKTMLLTHLASCLRGVQAWMPQGLFSGIRVVPGVNRMTIEPGSQHPLCGDDLLSLTLLVDRTPRTLLFDEWFDASKLTLERLDHWRALAEDAGHRIVVVMPHWDPISDRMDREAIRRAATRVIYLGKPPNGVNFIPDALRDVAYQPECGEMAIWRPVAPEGVVVRRLVADVVATVGV